MQPKHIKRIRFANSDLRRFGAYAETGIHKSLARRRQSRRAPIYPLGAVSTRNPYGLTSRELSLEVRRRLADGWQAWEIERRFGRAA